MSKVRAIGMVWGMMMIIMPVSAAVADRQTNALNLYRTGNSQPAGITEQRAIAIAQQHFKGRILAVNHSDDTYRIKILSKQGIVHVILINATNGTIISTH